MGWFAAYLVRATDGFHNFHGAGAEKTVFEKVTYPCFCMAVANTSKTRSPQLYHRCLVSAPSDFTMVMIPVVHSARFVGGTSVFKFKVIIGIVDILSAFCLLILL